MAEISLMFDYPNSPLARDHRVRVEGQKAIVSFPGGEASMSAHGLIAVKIGIENGMRRIEGDYSPGDTDGQEYRCVRCQSGEDVHEACGRGAEIVCGGTLKR